MVSTQKEMDEAGNQVVSRSRNERVDDNLAYLKSIATEEGEEKLVPNDSIVLLFLCECSDENCMERIRISLEDYRRFHENRERFTIAVGHEVPEIETIYFQNDEFYVVEKTTDVPQNATEFRATDVDNS